MPGVRAVYTGADIAQRVKPLRVGGSSLLRPVKLYPLAVEKVRYFGEPVAVVVADNRYLAEDAAEAVSVDYEILPVVDRHRSGDGAGRAAGARRCRQQYRLQVSLRHRRHRQSFSRRRNRHQGKNSQPPHHRLSDRAARLSGALQQRRRQPDDVVGDGQSPFAQRAHRRNFRISRGQDAA